MKPHVAVIPAAGRGTRLRPATRVVPKALITIVDRPSIQLVVEEAVRAGADEVILVVDLEAGPLIHDHFEREGPLPGLEHVRLRLAIQEEPLGLGHAIWTAAEAVGGRRFFCLLADVIVAEGDGVSPLAEFDESAVALQRIDKARAGSYGIADVEEVGGRLTLRGAVEKPDPSEAPSDLALIGRYLFTPEIFEVLASAKPGYGGEIQLTDAINVLAEGGRCGAAVVAGDTIDIGTPAGLVRAVNALAPRLLADE